MKLRYVIFGYKNSEFFSEQPFAVIDTAIAEMTRRSKKLQAEYVLMDYEFEGPAALAGVRAQAVDGHFFWLKVCPMCKGNRRLVDESCWTLKDCACCLGTGRVEA